MRVLLDVQGLLGQRLQEALSQQHDVRVLDGDPRHRETAARATAGVDAVISAVPDATSTQDESLPALDRASRGLFNLVTTASAGGGSRFVLLSSLRPFERYPLDYAVTEFWAPRPTTDLEDLIPFVSEAVVREASHAVPLTAICLRMGVNPEMVPGASGRVGRPGRLVATNKGTAATEARRSGRRTRFGHCPPRADARIRD